MEDANADIGGGLELESQSETIEIDTSRPSLIH